MEQELVVGEDEEGIVFHVEILFPTKRDAESVGPLQSLWTQLSDLYLVISHLTPRARITGNLDSKEWELNSEKSLKEYFSKEPGTWPRLWLS